MSMTNLILLALVLGLIPAEIARRKGHSFVGFYVFGVFLWILALVVAIAMKPKRDAQLAPHQ